MLVMGCGGGAPDGTSGGSAGTTQSAAAQDFPASLQAFGDRLDPARPANYAAQPVPRYITRDLGAPAGDALAALGRVLFYDRNLSVDGTIACASCHRQSAAFGDAAVASAGRQAARLGTRCAW